MYRGSSRGRGEAAIGGTVDGSADRVEPSEAERKRVAVELIRNHDGALKSSARRYSLCAADAEDAYQRGIEILLRKAPVADPRQLLPWARTVIKHESLALRRARERTLARPGERDRNGIDRDPDDWVERLEASGPRPEDSLVERERVDRSREALAELKPDERKALTQLAEGYSYAEIGSLNGWTYTKVNRCLAEGRERLRTVVSQSESGERCALVEPLISACADGELAAERVGEVENHLATCGRCRALLREYRSIPRDVAAFSPALGVLASTGQAGVEWMREAWFGFSARVHGLLAGNDRGLFATLAGGGARGSGPVALAKLTAVCIGTAGGAAACVATGVVPGLPVDGDRKDPSVLERRAEAGATASRLVPSASVDRRGSGSTDLPDVRRDEGEGSAEDPSPPPPAQVAREFGAGGGPGDSSEPATAPVPPTPYTPPVSSTSSPSPGSPSRAPVGGTGEFGP